MNIISRHTQPLVFGSDLEISGAYGGAAVPWWLSGGIAAANCYCAYQPKGAANYAASKLDLNTLGNNAADGAAFPTWDVVNGWKFDKALTQYLITAYTPDADQSNTMIIQYTNNDLAVNRVIVGGMNNALNAGIALQAQTGAGGVGYWNTGQRVVAPPLAAGNVCVAGTQGYRNGAPEGAAIGVVGGPYSAVYIGCTNRAGVGAALPSTVYVRAFALYTVAITAAQVLAVATAMAAL